ncbi:MAG: DNRLRE domain-containing protein [Polyangiaceae bacterium]|nr:DNRLRE domain-containing protein [Polyangiaceae bacterium]
MKQRHLFAAMAALGALLASSSALATASPSSGCIVIKRGTGVGDVYDSFVWDLPGQQGYAPGTYVETYTGTSSSGGEKKALFGFDLSPVPPYSVVSSAKLWVSIASNFSSEVRAHRVLAPWSEATVNYTNLGPIDPVVAGRFVSGGFGYKSMDISGLVQEWLNGTSPNHGILLEEGTTSSTSYKTGECGKPEKFPYLEVCYTEPPKSSVGDTVFFDKDADGAQNGDEPGIQSVVIDLLADTACDGLSDGTVIATAVTDLNGSYHFTGLDAGCYVVDIDDSTLPTGHMLTTGVEQLPVSLAPGQNKLDADFGYVTFSSIGDTVWIDSDADGNYDPDAGEAGVNGVLVELYSAGALVEYTYTADSPYTGLPGFYLFDTLAPGSYTVVVHASSFDEASPLFGQEPTGDHDGLLDNATTIALGWAEDSLLADFGYQPSCGNGVCGAAETCSSCALDCGTCPPACGDGSCNGDETCSSCTTDCGDCPPACGDGSCNGDETCGTCPADCGVCPPVCGNGVCEVSEDCSTCGSDCGACPAACGDGSCNGDETCSTCAGDCGVCPPTCGDPTCNGEETCMTCAADCGVCPPACGDGACNGIETCSTCAADCGACPPACGDGSCNGTETCSTCAADCNACAPACGDGSCNGTETCSTCAADCGACPPTCGDGSCNGDETCSICDEDCGTCPTACGNGTCETGESCASCAADCGPCPAACGNGACEATESCTSCAADCGSCPPMCGDGTCNETETCSACPSDCGLCPVVCGDQMCAATESCSSCAADCGSCPPVCGDGICKAGVEDHYSCPADCGGSCGGGHGHGHGHGGHGHGGHGQHHGGALGTATIGYWANHPEMWPVQQLTVGGKVYTKAQLIDIIKHPSKKDVTYSIAQQLIAAKLNVAAGNNSACIKATIQAADAWLSQHKLGSHVKGGSSAGTVGAPLNETLTSYNEGHLCAPHRG